jgi:hypothetical protein
MLNFTTSSYTADSHLTSSSPSTAEDSFCKTATSRREDIVSCIDVTIMDRFAHSALPSPHCKILFVAILEHRVDLARQAAKPRRVLLRYPQAQDRNSGRSKTGHLYSVPKSGLPITAWQTSRNARHAMHAALRVSLFRAGLKASVSRREIG